jgi:hypothetical protein
MLIPRKMITRKISMVLDPWYMAYNRAIITTCIIFQSSQYH